MAISEAWLKAQLGKDREKIEEFADRDAMSVRITPKGKIVFQLRYRYNGKQHRLDLGSYPNLTLKNARLESDRLRAELEKGLDPKQVRLKEKVSIRDAYTLETLFYEWYEKFCVPNKSSHNEIKRSFEIYVLPAIGKQNSDDISAYQWLSLLEDVAKKSPSISARLLINANQCLKWGQKRGLISVNHLMNVSAKHDLRIEKGVKERALSDKEIYLTWYALKRTKMTYKNKLFLTLLIIYGCRVGELKLAKKSHFDLKEMIWTVPPENHKTGKKSKKPILRPITENIKPYLLEAMEFSQGSEYLFTIDGFNQAKAVPEGFVVVAKELPEKIAEKMAIDRIDKPIHENNPVWSEIAEESYKNQVKLKKWGFWRDYKAMIEAQEPTND
jgi:integrase